jgi:putative serine protease PepD
MTDPRAQGPAAAPHEPDAGTPPPSPWWSRPQEQWDAPREQADDASSSGQPPYGGYLSPPATDIPRSDPWSSPATRATFPSGAQPWATPTDTIGGRPPEGARSRRGVGTAALVLATALLAGATGGVVGARYDGERDLLDPSASLGSGTSTSASLDRDPESVAGVAARVMRSTVSIAVRGNQGNGTGSGVIIRSDGYLLTNNHVIASAADGGRITVTLDNGEQELPAEIVGRDPVTDLAVLQVQTSSSLPAATLGSSSSLVVGDPVIAIGSPLGLSGTVTTGIISALNRTVDVPSEDGTRNPLFNAIQTDAAINPGNSGGALVNAKGEVIGINSAIATLGGGGLFGGEQQGGSIGVGFAIPVDEAKSVAEEIIRTGEATHPSIGVSATTVTAANRKGALVRELTPGGAASKAGMSPNDLITEVEGEEVASVDDLILAVRSHKIGETVTITFERDGETREVDVVLQDLQR